MPCKFCRKGRYSLGSWSSFSTVYNAQVWICYLLRLLGYQQGQLKVVESKSVVVKSIDIRQKADMFNG